MVVFYILVILTLGYYRASNIPVEKIKLKRSSGYGTYAHLGITGFGLILQGLFVLLLVFGMFYFFACIFDWLISFFDDAIKLAPYLTKIWLYEFPTIQMKTYHLGTLLFAWAMCEGQIRNCKDKIDYQAIRQQDSILDITIDALLKQTSVKISLKSKKVYVGLIYSEQFEQVDLDNIVIIPLLSVSRHKYTLVLNFDCNYSTVYEKNGFNFEDLPEFRIVFRVAEIESISLFNFNYFDDFEEVAYSHVKKSAETESTQAT